MDDTRIEFGAARRDEARAPADVDVERERHRCASCGQRFSGSARFCPFDGAPLEPAPAEAPEADPLLGQTLDGRYQVEAALGEGGMGVVYRARHVRLGRAFAVKVLKRELALDKELSARFIQEARAAAAVTHANVVQITDFGELPSGQPYFVMELLEGRSLSALIRRGGPIPAARAVRIVRQVADALDAAHGAGIVHRDLKPDNIHVGAAIGDRDTVKVLDFGLAKVAGASRLTRAGVVFGTPSYMSPEQASGEAVDHRADVYALGVVMYEMFTGRVPFEADTYMGVLTKHMYMAPVPPSRLIEAGHELGALEDVTLRCLEKKPAQRFPSMRALIEELDRVTRWADDGSLDVMGGAPSSTRRQRSLLADELEPPTAEELRVEQRLARRERPRSRARVLLGVGCLFGVAGVALAGLARWRSEAPAPAGAAPPPEVARVPLEPGSLAPVGTPARTLPSAAAPPASAAPLASA
ncbi:MAG: serine/threonine-protein kinase, partial [Sorangiineae bacterium]|nr:serine/threonine-protein kinase [Sorangiineae bacterium]